MLRLKTVLVCQSELLDLCLTVRTVLPIYLRTFVTADMEILRREEISHLSENILEEHHGLFLSGAEHLVSDAPAAPDFVRASGTSQFRIGGQGCKHMTRKVDFRNDSDTPGCGIIDDLADLLLREPAALAVRYAVVFPVLEEMAHKRLLPY